MSYRNLEIWQFAREVSLDIHEMSLKLPKFEQFEEAHQIRRSNKSVRANIVEGYGRRLYQGDLVRFIVVALASNDETIDHLETLYESKSLIDEQVYSNLSIKLKSLGIKLSRFLKSMETNHSKPHFYSSPGR